MEKFGSCEFTVNDLVSYTGRDGTYYGDTYQVIEVLYNTNDGTYEDRPFVENYWIRNTHTNEKYRVFHSEITLHKQT